MEILNVMGPMTRSRRSGMNELFLFVARSLSSPTCHRPVLKTVQEGVFCILFCILLIYSIANLYFS